jgi:hypothetical protein
MVAGKTKIDDRALYRWQVRSWANRRLRGKDVAGAADRYMSVI